jgi:hypothetical protein
MLTDHSQSAATYDDESRSSLNETNSHLHPEEKVGTVLEGSR